MIGKILFRLYRILTLRYRIYGKLGKKNKFTFGVFINEMAQIGDYNYFGPYTMVNNAIIGNFCSIAPSVKIGPGNHSKSFITTCNKISSELINFKMYNEPAVIGNDVWLGANVVVLQGVKIGNGAIVGANSLVNKDIPDFSIAVGNPAKIIGYRFDEDTIKTIDQSQWWNHDIEEAKKIINAIKLSKGNNENV